MTDHPMLYSAPMVRALLADIKSQTRRLIKVAPPEATSAGTTYSTETGHSNTWTWLSGDPRDADTWEMLGDFRLPHKPGDRLYVREHWRTNAERDHVVPRDLPTTAPIYFEADGEMNHALTLWGRFRQGMHMPRWASRLTLHVTDARVQRLWDIDEGDAMCEGAEIMRKVENGVEGVSFRAGYAAIWEAINGPGSWSLNPWVAAYTFEVERCNIAQARSA